MKSIMAPGRVSGQVEARDAQATFLVVLTVGVQLESRPELFANGAWILLSM